MEAEQGEGDQPDRAPTAGSTGRTTAAAARATSSSRPALDDRADQRGGGVVVDRGRRHGADGGQPGPRAVRLQMGSAQSQRRPAPRPGWPPQWSAAEYSTFSGDSRSTRQATTSPTAAARATPERSDDEQGHDQHRLNQQDGAGRAAQLEVHGKQADESERRRPARATRHSDSELPPPAAATTARVAATSSWPAVSDRIRRRITAGLVPQPATDHRDPDQRDRLDPDQSSPDQRVPAQSTCPANADQRLPDQRLPDHLLPDQRLPDQRPPDHGPVRNRTSGRVPR